MHYVEAKKFFLVKPIEVVAINDTNDATERNLEQVLAQISNLCLHLWYIFFFDQAT